MSNPPYIDEHDEHLKRGDVRYEPASALIAGEGGLADLRHIIEQSPRFLSPGGWLLVEHGWTQGEAVRELFAKQFLDVDTRRDLAGNPRVTIGRRSV